jgi:hypothetical protein
MTDAITSSLGSMMVGYECSFPARMDKQLMEVGQALGLHHQTVQRCVERAVAEARGPDGRAERSPSPWPGDDDHAGSESLVDIAVVPEGEGAGLSA